MEYVFGTSGINETLKTVGSTHTNLSGYQETVREYTDSTITDQFYVVKKTDSKEDIAGNCYDFYIINRHTRVIDKTKLIKEQEEQNTANIDYLAAMCDVELPNEEDE